MAGVGGEAREPSNSHELKIQYFSPTLLPLPCPELYIEKTNTYSIVEGINLKCLAISM